MSDQPKLSDPTYQDKDINLFVLSLCIAGIAVVILASFLGMKALYNSYEADYESKKHSFSKVAPSRELPSAALLQVDEAKDLADYMDSARAAMEAPGVRDEQTGTAMVPVEEAKQLVLERGVGPLSGGAGN